jgi:phthiocerol/phenolphthiocerol synthesis type-I polyketide synthase A
MTATALHESAGKLAEALDAMSPAPPMAELAVATNRRADHPYRLAAVARVSKDLAETLRGYADGSDTGRVRASPRPANRPKVAFVFPGQGSQWLGMGRDLLAREPVFHATIRACDTAAAEFVDWSILAELQADDGASRLDRIDVVQPVLFAMEVALARLWESWGLRPDAVVGHSMGEVAAAHIAGAISLSDAARVICRRSKLMRGQSGKGAMLAVELTVSQAAEAIGARGELVSIAVSNSRRSTVLSGDRDTLTAIAEELGRREVFCRWVKVDVASHSPQMDALRDDLRAQLGGVSGRPVRIPMYSTVTGTLSPGTDLDAGYWIRNLRMPVLFSDQIENLTRAGYTVFVEMSPHPILLPAVQQVAMDLDRSDIAVLPSLRRGEPARDIVLDSLGALYVLGASVDRKRVATPGPPGLALPGYPWQRQRYRIEDTGTVRLRRRDGSLLGGRLDSAIEPGTHYWQPEIDRATVADHVIDGDVIVPGSVYLDLALSAAREVLPRLAPPGCKVTGLRFVRPLVVGETGRRVQLTLVHDEQPGSALVRIFAGEADDPGSGLSCVAEATVSAISPGPDAPCDVTAVERGLIENGLSGDDYYTGLAEHGLGYGPAFRWVRRISSSGPESWARIGAPPGAREHAVHPALLDAALQVAVAPVLAPEWGIPGGIGLISTGIERVVVRCAPDTDCYVHALLWRSGVGFRADVSVYGLAGELLIEATGVTLLRWVPTVQAAGIPTHAAVSGDSGSRTIGPIPGLVRDSLLELPSGAERRAAVEKVTTECVATVARIPVAGIDPRTPLRALGIDSLMTLELRNQLEGQFGATLTATVIGNHPTVRQLAQLVAHRAGIPLDDLATTELAR